MNFKRAVWVGIVAYIASFIMGMIVMALIGLDPTSLEDISQSVLIVNIIITIVVAAFFTFFYFRDRRIKASAKEGFYFGLVLVAIGFVLDAIIFSLSSAFTGMQQSLIEYYANPLFWLALVLFVATTTIVGAIKSRKK